MSTLDIQAANLNALYVICFPEFIRYSEILKWPFCKDRTIRSWTIGISFEIAVFTTFRNPFHKFLPRKI